MDNRILGDTEHSAAIKAGKIARAAATHRDAVEMIFAAGLASDLGAADELIRYGVEILEAAPVRLR